MKRRKKVETLKRQKDETAKRRNVEKAKRRNSPVLVGGLCLAMEEIAPIWAAAEWDNVGLLVGSPDWSARRILLTIDISEGVLDEAIRGRFDCVVSYHPPIFKPTPRMLVQRATQEGVAAEALSRGIAVYSPHTALDAAPGGTNDTLATLCGVVNAEPFCVVDHPHSLGRCKLVVFVPAESVDAVSDSLFRAGCGLIGGYEKCSFRSDGTGTFLGTASTNPRVGKRGRLERVPEIRLEVVVFESDLSRAVSAMIAAHPYETPAFDIYKLRGTPSAGTGQGRIGRLAKAISLGSLARMLKRKTGAAGVSIVGDPRSIVERAAICAGAAGKVLLDAPDLGGRKDAVITGEFRHHDALEYQRRGVGAIALGHWASERPVLQPLAVRLRRALPSATVSISRADHDPFAAV